MSKDSLKDGRRRIGIVGFGSLGQFLVQQLLVDAHLRACFDIAFIWNRTPSKLTDLSFLHESIGASATEALLHLPNTVVLHQLDDFATRGADLIIEVAHPVVYETHGEMFLLAGCDLCIGSPTALANANVYRRLITCLDELKRKCASSSTLSPSLYFPSGALWGADDILKMGSKSAISRATISMRKPPGSMRLVGELEEKRRKFDEDSSGERECLLYRGPVRALCSMAPNNVNTMACLAVASNLGFDAVEGTLIADKSISAHIIEIEMVGFPVRGRDEDDVFRLFTRRYNPCDPNAVTASATYHSFAASISRLAIRRPPGIHFC